MWGLGAAPCTDAVTAARIQEKIRAKQPLTADEVVALKCAMQKMPVTGRPSSEATGGGMPWGWLALGAAVLGVGAWLMLRKKSTGYAPNRGKRRANRVWKYGYKKSLPDSAFLLPGERKFPYKTKTGKIDLPHLRNALARIPQSNLPKSTQERLTKKARAILDRQAA